MSHITHMVTLCGRDAQQHRQRASTYATSLRSRWATPPVRAVVTLNNTGSMLRRMLLPCAVAEAARAVVTLNNTGSVLRRM